MNSLEETVKLYEEFPKHLRNRIVYETFGKHVEADEELHNSFTLCDGFGELPFSWNWKLLIDAMPTQFNFLEIGVYKGRVLAQVGMLANRTHKQATLIGVTPLSDVGDKYSRYDDLDYLHEIHANFKRCNVSLDCLEIIKGFSQNADIASAVQNKGKFDIVFIDGSHDYDGVCSDIYNYAKMVKSGGFLITDDSSLYIEHPYGRFIGHPDVSKAVKDYLDTDFGFKHLYAVGHNRVWHKT